MLYRRALLVAAAAGVNAIPAPMPQGVTVAIAPSESAPAGCATDFAGSFGIAVMSGTGSAGAASVSQTVDGQPQAGTSAAPVSQITDGQPQAGTASVVPVTQITDGQVQATTNPTVVMMAPITQISDGQVQGATHVVTMMAVSQIGDGQVQAPTVTMMPVTQISDGQPQAPHATFSVVSQISDGQPQAPTGTAAPVSQITDGQPQAPTGSASPVSQITDGQPQAPTGTAVSQISDGQPQASAGASVAMVACANNDTLALTLEGSVLLDAQGRTGYIAANYQFQFDKPAQTGAIFTSGFSVCSNGSLALGGSTVFYQCLSGNFYNLYDRSWAPQCEPITISVVTLQTCA